ncbi:MAG: NAD(P)H-hydrate dehydratase [Corynebacterium sp.]|nr:NAD(P)H-hydrate dehydratase [Corynebacterium sp.]
MFPAFSVAAVRAAEEELLAVQTQPDELMRQAAQAVAQAAQALTQPGDAVLVVAGPGGNGGDGLYAASLLAPTRQVTVVFADDKARNRVQPAGVAVVEVAKLPADYRCALLIDAIAGLASSRPVDEHLAALSARAERVLAIDVPTGVDADTGQAASPCIHADVTITFGAARAAHAFAPECGRVVVADLTLPQATRTFGEILRADAQPVAWMVQEDSLPTTVHAWPSPLTPVPHLTGIPDVTPTVSSHKYTDGVTVLAAGSEKYPGAGLLAATGALHTTASMVVAVPPESLRLLIISRHPEIVIAPSVTASPKVNCVVIGPGRGTDALAADELRTTLTLPVPVLIDADAIHLIAQHDDIQDLVRQRHSAHKATLLTPHAGELATLAAALGLEADQPRAETLSAVTNSLHATVLLKGRTTLITGSGLPILSVNAGNSFAATAGTGDVLSGICGALLARLHTHTTELTQRSIADTAAHAVVIHAHAAALAATTPAGYAPTTASALAAAIPTAIASLLSH